MLGHFEGGAPFLSVSSLCLFALKRDCENMYNAK